MTAGTILLIEDERTLARAIQAFLSEEGYEVTVAHDAESALEQLETVRPDLVFSDVRLPGMDGIALLKCLQAFDPGLPVIILTAHGSVEGAVEAMKLGAFHYLKKPVDLDELKLLAERARESRALTQELRYYRSKASPLVSGETVVGASRAIGEVLERAREIAVLEDTPPVLITGETGSGKGLIARTIHSSGPRSAKPFIDVNCTALPATLMEAELFGYERGAFTDAKESKLGLFEAAEGGFIFLDEVGDLETALQGKLLRAIEERVVRRVGGIRDRRVNVRILAATNRDLASDVGGERFRRDLYYRLAVLVLHLPPLRERGDDVLLLAERFLRLAAAKYGRPARRLTTAAAGTLRAYPWPGNVRELSHVIERAVLWSRGDEVTVDHLGLSSPPEAPTGATPGAHQGSALPPPGQTLEQWERSALEQALQECGGNQTRAAQRLGISRDTLRYRIKKFGLTGDN
ncbi:MAG: sigma-54-dependent Fis family transcriptional regulator [Gemmatimonadales bacterium]|nr:MAG: sigma-54-dependent Fis family transcriptional regulator [Gemmatimonadales bacterium]